MSRSSTVPSPRLVLGFITAILIVQGVYAAIEIFGDGTDPDQPLEWAIVVAFVAYAVVIAAFAVGVGRRAGWAWVFGIVAAASGLGLVGLQVLAGDRADQHMIGVLIDGALLYYLTKPSIRALFQA